MIAKPKLSYYNTSRYKLILCFSMSIFFYLFLIFFLPFGVSNFDPNHAYTVDFLLEILNFFGITLVFALVNEFLIKPYFVRTVSIKAVVAWSIWTLVLLGTINFLTYNLLGNWHDFHLASAVPFVFNCSTVLIFPLVGTFYYFRYLSLQERIEHFQSGNDANLDMDQLITFEGDGNKDKISLSVSAFMYVRAQDNYAAIHYQEQSKASKQLIRTSLGKLAGSIDHQAVMRCHRSYIVNLMHVNAVKGGKKEIVLYLGPADISIPVSKSYRDPIMDRLHEVKNMD